MERRKEDRRIEREKRCEQRKAGKERRWVGFADQQATSLRLVPCLQDPLSLNLNFGNVQGMLHTALTIFCKCNLKVRLVSFHLTPKKPS